MPTRTISDAGGNWNATGTWAEGAVPTSADDVVASATSGNLTINATATCKSLVLTGYKAGSAVTHNSGITLTVVGNVTLTAGQYIAAADTANITITGSAATLTTAGCLLGALTYNKAAGTLTLGDNLAFRAGVGCVLTITTGTLDLAGKTLAGNSATNRVLLASATVGTSAAVTVSSGTFANADFMDIAFANGGSNLDLSAITGLSGDCGGNAMSGGGTLTFTIGRTCNWKTAAGGNWSGVANWDTTDATDRVPLPQDDVTFACAFSSGVTVLSDMPRMGADIDWSGATWTGTAPTWRGSIALLVFGSITCVSGLLQYSNGLGLRLAGRGAYTLLWAGLQVNTIYIWAGSYTLLDVVAATSTINITSGSLMTDGYSVTTGLYLTVSGTSTFDFTGSTVTLLSPGLLGCFSMAATATLVTAGSTLVFGSMAGTWGCGMGPHTYHDIVLTPHATTAFTFSGDFTFANMSMAATGALTVKFVGGPVVTMTGDTFLSGSDGAPITLTSSDTNQFTLTYAGASDYVSSDWLSIDYCTTDSAAHWYAGANSVDGGHNGTPTWTFAAPATGLPMAEFSRQFYQYAPGPEVY
jgi:hypothetical protein